MDKTRDSKNSKSWPVSTCAISVRRKGQILLVVGILVLSTTLNGNKIRIQGIIVPAITNCGPKQQLAE